MKFILPTLLMMSFTTMAKEESCYRIKDCIETAEELTNKRYFYNYSDIEKNIKVVGLKMNEQNVDELISRLLFTNGLTRIATSQGYQVLPSKNIRNTPVPLFEKEIDVMPNTYDYYMVSVPIKYVKAKDINKSLRSFMSVNGRILPLEYNSSILLMDTAINIKRFKQLIAQLDIPKNRKGKKKRR